MNCSLAQTRPHRISLSLSARTRDEALAKQITEFETAGVLPNIWNGDTERERRSAHRRQNKYIKGRICTDEKAELIELEGQLREGNTAKKKSEERQREIKARVKEIKEAMKSISPRQPEHGDLRAEKERLEVEQKTGFQARRDWEKRRDEFHPRYKELKERLKGARLTGVTVRNDTSPVPLGDLDVNQSAPPSPAAYPLVDDSDEDTYHTSAGGFELPLSPDEHLEQPIPPVVYSDLPEVVRLPSASMADWSSDFDLPPEPGTVMYDNFAADIFDSFSATFGEYSI